MAAAGTDCAHCGAAAFPGERFARTGWRRRAICPHCREAHRSRGLWRDLLLLAGWLALAAMLAPPVAVLAAVLAVNLALLLLALAAGVVLHEAGHAVVARALGFDVHAVRIGSGRLRRTVVWAGLPWEWRGWPDAGLLVAARTERRGLRWRLLAMVVAGPAVTVATTALLAACAGALRTWPAALIAGPAPLHAALLAHGLLTAACLVPWVARIGGQPHPSDALHAIALLAAPAAHIEQHAQAAWAMRAEACRRAGDAAGARDALQRGLALHPGSFLLQHDRARLRLDAGHWREARAEFLALLERPEAAAAPVRRLVASNAAFALLLSDERTLHDLAARESRALLSEAPAPHALVGTHALALIRSGELETGAAMARRLVREATESCVEASAWASLALVAHERGEGAACAAALGRARALEPADHVAVVVRRRVDAAARAA